MSAWQGLWTVTDPMDSKSLICSWWVLLQFWYASGIGRSLRFSWMVSKFSHMLDISVLRSRILRLDYLLETVSTFFAEATVFYFEHFVIIMELCGRRLNFRLSSFNMQPYFISTVPMYIRRRLRIRQFFQGTRSYLQFFSSHNLDRR